MTRSGRVVCFGEVLLRLSAPASELLLQTPRLDVHVGGAEANVAVSLACLGHETAVVGVLPDNPLGRAARDELRRYGVGTRGLRFAPGRMGLYFLSLGAVLRPSDITYDRADSAFAAAAPDAIDWERELDGAAWLHVSGATAAVGPNAAQAVVRAVREAKRRGVSVSFDGNYRAKMWAAWDGDAPGVLRSILECADIAFADDRDMSLVLEQRFGATDLVERRRAAAAAAFEAFPGLRRLASTVRVHHGVGDQELSALMFARDREHATRTFRLSGVVDRIGGGDAFAAGVLHGLIRGRDDRAALEFGLAAACLKHAVPGDFNLVREEDVLDLLAGGGLDVRR